MLEREIGEKKKRKICVFLMEKGRMRPPAAFKLGWTRGTFPECSFGDNDRGESSEPISVRLFSANQRPLVLANQRRLYGEI
tara:strand:- start:428 stop:670 length:243 start_codon:yes stop_codon:yes gene_type:complete